MGADEEGKALATPEYWDSRYTTSTSNEPTHEWFRSYDALEPFFSTHLFPTYPSSSNPQIVHLGSGDSTIPFDLATKNGYKNQLCLDFSQVVVDMMSERHKEVEGITWRWADVRDMQGQDDGSVDVAFDKGTLDAMIHGSPWNPPDQVREDTGRYMREVSIPTIILRYTGGILLSMIKVHRVLKPTGVFLYITFRQPHFIKPLLDPDGSLWDLQMETLGGVESSFDYFAFVLRKK